MRFLRRHLIGAVAFLVLLFMAVQTYIGEHGLQARSVLKSRIFELNSQLTILQARREDLERETALMAPEQVNRDMLEYEARRQLNFVYQNERIYVPKRD